MTFASRTAATARNESEELSRALRLDKALMNESHAKVAIKYFTSPLRLRHTGSRWHHEIKARKSECPRHLLDMNEPARGKVAHLRGRDDLRCFVIDFYRIIASWMPLQNDAFSQKYNIWWVNRRLSAVSFYAMNIWLSSREFEDALWCADANIALLASFDGLELTTIGLNSSRFLRAE